MKFVEAKPLRRADLDQENHLAEKVENETDRKTPLARHEEKLLCVARDGQAPSGGGPWGVLCLLRMESKSVGRNEPCPCGSGKKYKRCHGADAEPKVSETARP